MTGTWGPGEGERSEAILVRADYIPTTLYTNDVRGYSLQVPTSWTSEAIEEDIPFTSIHPLGRKELGLAVGTVPEPNGRPLVEIVEDVMSGDHRISLNPTAAFAGRKGVQVEWRYSTVSENHRATSFFTYVGDKVLRIDSSFPIKEESIWAPVLERMKGTFRIGE
ncbi:hypothetical protein EON81_27215 [bacterium]|nr:MAG: hypothetical protein EON81_27215 [bacterium]